MSDQINIVLYGMSRSGKTTFIKLIRDEIFDEEYIETQTMEQANFELSVGSKKVSLCIFDAPGKLLYGTYMTVSTYGTNGPLHIHFVPEDNEKAIDGLIGYFVHNRYVQETKVGKILFVVNHKDKVEGHPPYFSKLEQFANEQNATILECSFKETEETRQKFVKFLSEYIESERLKGKKGKKKGGCNLF